jgi:serine/threonine protein kinase
MSPEYASYGELSTKVDVYSFGVLMLEIISGRKSILNFTSTSTEQISLVNWVSTFKYLAFYPFRK